MTAFDISPDGKRAVLTARGDVYTVPAKEGSIRNSRRRPGIRENGAAGRPTARWIAYLSDRTGEDEIYLMPQDGVGQRKSASPPTARCSACTPVWSPDSKKLAFADKSLRLFYVDINEKKPVLIDQGKYFDLTDYSWSPDSQWIAYAKNVENSNGVINLYSLADKKITPVTTDFTNSFNPVFDPGGKYLYFLSNRDYNEVLGVYDLEFSNPKPTRVYVVTLRADTPSPFAPQSDEAAIASPEAAQDESARARKARKRPKRSRAKKPKAKDQPQKNGRSRKKTGATKAAEQKPFRIDLEGIGNRVVALPMPPAIVANARGGQRLHLLRHRCR